MSRHFQATLQGLAVFKKEMVKPAINEMPPEMLKSIKYYLLLKDYIRAINRKHFSTVVSMEKAFLYRFRSKNECTKNVMVVYFIRHAFHMDIAWREVLSITRRYLRT